MSMVTGPKITRLDKTELQKFVGKRKFSYLTSKLRGGANGFKGFSYEQLFGVHRIARLGTRLIDKSHDAYVEWQSDGFVDDFVVRRDNERAVKAYQLKNALAVSWTNGKHSIRGDFKVQHGICKKEGYSSIKLRLVNSNADVVDQLRAEIPTSLKKYTKVFFFPYEQSYLLAMSSHDWMAADVGALSRNDEPTAMEAAEVAGVLAGALAVLGAKGNISDIVAKARTMSPQLIRSMQPNEEAVKKLKPQFTQLLDAIPDFKYDVVRGFFKWSAFGDSTKGVFSSDCFSTAFENFQELVILKAPKTFEEIEGAL